VANITVEDVQAWLEETKLEIGSLDSNLESQVATEVLGRVSTADYDVTGWIDPGTTPKLIRKIIAMLYAGWFYDRQYSETSDTNDYALRLKEAAEALLKGIVEGTTDIVEVPGTTTLIEPVFFPTDDSSSVPFNPYVPGDGPAAFSMGARF